MSISCEDSDARPSSKRTPEALYSFDSSDSTDPAVVLESPTKRRRIEREIDPYPQWSGSFWKNAKIWCSDGDIILICQDMGFRVQKGILVDHSKVFRKMLSDAEANVECKTWDGCKVVHLQDDTSPDVYHLLLALQSDR